LLGVAVSLAVLTVVSPPFLCVAPEIDQLNYVAHVKQPTLMINGRHDYIFPHDTAQVPLFRLLGTPVKDKHQFVFETGRTT
jgi:hypothetical protein